MFSTPVLLIVFNRPGLTARVLESLQQLQPQYLFVAADGPRANNTSDVALCEQTRALVASKVNWPCTVKTLYQSNNLGCGKAVSSAITWFFEHNAYGIILEDDCLPHPGFYNFCEELLLKYKNNEQVMHIGGTNFQNGIVRGEGSYYFSGIMHVWGWATWRRAWNNYDFSITNLDEFLAQKKIEQYYTDKKSIQYWKNVFRQMQNSEIDTWDHQWTYSVWKKSGLAIIPQKNLVANIGFGADATHTHTTASKLENMPTFSIGELVHPKAIVQDKAADNYTFYQNYYRPSKNSLVYRGLRKLKSMFR